MQYEHEQPLPGDALPHSDASPAGLSRYFLRRLERVVDLRRGRWGELNPEELKATDWAIYSTLLDCIGLDVGTAARDLVRRHFGEPHPAGVTPPQSGRERDEGH